MALTRRPAVRPRLQKLLKRRRRFGELRPLEPPNMLRRTGSQVAVVRRHFPTATDLSDEAAMRSAVLGEMRAHDLYHFACHGCADTEDPLRSRLLVHDGPLTLLDLIKERFPAARLAVLSACETSVPDPDLPDEVISLPSALVEAGVPGSIGSLWRVRERPTALLMARFYELWLTEGMAPPAALGEAQRWLRDSTRAELEDYSKDFLTWPRRTRKAAERLAGERTYAHPDDWAAFVYTGR
jgi:CHAT domain-containing protein